MIPKGLKLPGTDPERRMAGASPCPFCGSRAIFLQRFDGGYGAFYRAKCAPCNAWGPRGNSAEEARRHWEARTP